jgi:hypothetical protein
MSRILERAMGRIYRVGEGEQQGGGGGDQVTAADARAFVGGFVPDPKVLEGMDDAGVMAYHGQVRTALDGHVKTAFEKHDWRKDVAGDNADALKTLERFQSPKALYESYDQLRGRMAKGELKAVTPFPDKGTPEQQNAWRTENGIPLEAGKYELKLPEGVVVGEEDKPILEGFLKHAHAQNMPPAAVNAAAAWWFQERTGREEAARAGFETKKTETAAALGAEWGAEYKPNLNKIQGVIDSTIPEDQKELKTLINNAIATNPHFARHYAAIALQLNPAGTLVPGDRGANEASVTDGIKKIEASMKSNRAAYNKDEGMQKQYRDYLGAYKQLTGKDWAGG